MASRPSSVVTRNVALLPYIRQITRERTGTVWGVDLELSDDRVVLISAYRSLEGRWSGTDLLYRITKKGMAYDTRIIPEHRANSDRSRTVCGGRHLGLAGRTPGSHHEHLVGTDVGVDVLQRQVGA